MDCSTAFIVFEMPLLHDCLEGDRVYQNVLARSHHLALCCIMHI